MSDTIKNLIYKVQSDFTDAERGLSSFSDKMNQLVDNSTDIGRKMASQINASLGSVKLPDLALQFAQAFPESFSKDVFAGLRESAESLVVTITKMRAEMQAMTGVNFTKGTEQGFETLSNKAVSLAQTYEKLRVAQEKLDKNPSNVGAAAQVDKLKQQAEAAVTSINASFDKLANRKDIQLNFGGQQIKEEFAQIEEQVQGLMDNTGKLNDGLKTLADNPFFKGTVANQVKQMKEEFASLSGEQDKLESMAKKVADAFATINAQPGGIGTGEQFAKATEALNKYADQALKVKDIQSSLDKTLGETQGVDRFMASLGAGTLDRAQGFLKDTTKAVLDLSQALIKTGDNDAVEKLAQQFPLLARGMQQTQNDLQLIPDLMTKIRSGGVDSVDALLDALIRLDRETKFVAEDLRSMSNTTEGLKATGITALTTQLQGVSPAIAELKQDMAGLIDQQAKLNSSPLTRVFNPDGIKQTSAAVIGLNKDLDDTIAESSKAAEALGRLSAGSATADIKKTEDAITKLNERIAGLKTSMSSLGQVQATTSAFGGLNEIMGEMGIKTALLATGFFGWFSVIQTGIGTLKGIISAGADWQTQLVQLQNSTDLSAQSIDKVKSSLTALSTATGTPMGPLIESFKDLVQMGNSVDVALAMVVAGTKSVLAVGGDEKTVIESLARIMGNYKDSAMTVNEANNAILVGSKASGIGLTAYGEQLTKVSAVAGTLHIPFQAAAAGVAILDRAIGGGAANSGVAANMFEKVAANLSKVHDAVALIDPQKAAIFTPENLKTADGMSEILNGIVTIAKSNPDILAKAFGMSATAVQGLAAGNANLQDTKKIAADVAEAMAGKLDPATAAANRTLNTQAQQTKILGQEWENLKRTVSAPITSPLTGLLKAINDGLIEDSVTLPVLVEGFKKLYDAYNNMFFSNPKNTVKEFGEGLKDLIMGPSDKQIADAKERWQKLQDAASGKSVAGGAGGDDADALTNSAQDIAAKIASSVTTIAKGIEDALKLLAEAKNVKIPDNIEALIQPLAEAIKKIYDTFANVVGNENNSGVIQKVAQAVNEQITALKNMAEIFKSLPTLDISDPSAKIDALVAATIKFTASFTKLVTDKDSGVDPGASAAAGEIAQSMSKQVTLLKDVAEMLKAAASVDISADYSNTITKLSHAIGEVSSSVMPQLEKENSLNVESLAKVAEGISKQVTLLKDMAELFKAVATIDFSQNYSRPISLLAAQIATVADNTIPELSKQSQKSVTDLGVVAEGISKQVTLLKDMAELFKAAAEVDFSEDYRGPIVKLSQSVSQVVSSLLPELSRQNAAAETQLGTIAEGIGKQVNLLKDVAELLKNVDTIDVSQDYSNVVSKLVQVMVKVASDVASAVGGSSGSADLSRFAEMAGKEVKAVTDTVKLLNDLQTLPTIDTNKMTGEIDKVVSIVAQVVAYFEVAMSGLSHSSSTDKLAIEAANVFKPIADAVKVITDLELVPSIDTAKLTGQMDKVVDVINSTLSYFDSHLQQISNGGEIQAISKDAIEVMKAIGDTVKVIEDMMVLPKISDQKLKDGIDYTILVMIAALKYFDTQVQGLEQNPLTTKIAEEIGKVMGTIDTTLKVFETLGTKKHLVMNANSIRDAVDAAIGSAKYFIDALDQSGIDDGALAKASKVAEEITKILDALEKINGKTTTKLGASKGGTTSSISHSGGIGNLGNLNSFLGGLGDEEGSQSKISIPTFPVSIPRPQNQIPANFNFNPSAPAPTKEPATNEKEPIVVNTEIHMDSQVIGKAMDQKMFQGQTLRQNLIP